MREYFQTDLTAGSPGQFDAVGGTILSRRGGPTTADGTTLAAPGRGGVFASSADTYGQVTNVAAYLAGLRWGGFFWFKSFVATAGGNSKVSILALHNFSQWNELVAAQLDKNGLLSSLFYRSAETSSTQLLLNTWYWIGIKYLRPGNTGNYTARIEVQPVGGAPVVLGMVTPVDPLSGPLNLHVGVNLGSYNPYFRVGAVAADAITSFSDPVIPADLVEPADTALDWYLDPIDGNDANDGSALASAWKTAAKVSSETALGGILSRNSYAAGDALYIANADGSTLARTIGPITFSADGLNVRPAAGFAKWVACGVKALTNASFAPVDGHANVYRITDAVSGAWVGEFDASGNPVWYAIPATANSATALATLDATPGSGWNDGTYTYVHALGSTDPRADGKTYFSQRSASGHLVSLGAKHLHLTNFEAWGQINVGTAGFSVQYCVGDGPGFGGTSLIENGYIHHWNNHGIGFVISASDEDLTVRNVRIDQGSPYGAAGNHTPGVSFMNGGNAESGNTHLWQSCDFTPYRGTIGTSGQAVDTNMWAWITHNQGNANKPYASLTLKSCNVGGGVIGRNTVNTDNFTIDNCGSYTFSGSDLVAVSIKANAGGSGGITRLTSPVAG